jgi:hypothetical protein
MKLFSYTNFAKALLLLFAMLIVFMLNSCVTYKKCKDKFSMNYTDTTYVTVQVRDTIKKDSVNMVYRNDTNFTKVIETARTTLRIQKEPTYTYITCESKEIIKTVTVKAPCPPVPQTWGVAPWHRTVNYVLLGALILALLCIIILFYLKRNNITLFHKNERT